LIFALISYDKAEERGRKQEIRRGEKKREEKELTQHRFRGRETRICDDNTSGNRRVW
jgi:hypothetical protein